MKGINDAGQIVGSYSDGNNHNHSFVLTITPNPPPPAGTTADMILRGANTSPAVAGQYEIYDIGSNAILAGYSLGAVGVDWQAMGFGNFSGMPGETGMILRNSYTGGVEVYDINNNQITGAAFIGTVGLEWQFSGVGNFSSIPGESDLLLRNVNSGAFEVYDIANNQLTEAAPLGTVGLDWQLGGFAVDPPTVSGTFTDISNDQLVQAMAGFGGGSGAGESLNAGPLSAETSQQQFLTTPQHA